VMKVDVAQVIREGVAMVGTIATYENDVRYATSTTEVEVAKKKPGVTVVHSVLDENVVTTERFANQCPNSLCTGSDLLMQLALAGQTGAIVGPDYRNTPTLGAYTFLPGLEVGIVVKIDVNEANSNAVTLALELTACAVGAVLVSMGVLALLANVLLKTMDRTWDEGKKAIEREKELLCGVITAMYPPQVAKRMLAGETHIVHNIGCATVFFSDIYEFTTASNTITPEQLMQFLGYTFGLMDMVADHFRVHKIKTIGDACRHLAVSGLPGTESPNGNGTLDMMLFASCCVQLFGQRFVHPDEGTILDTVARNLFQKKQHVKMLEGPEAVRTPAQDALYDAVRGVCGAHHRRCFAGQDAAVRHLGADGEPREPHGEHRAAGAHPGGRGRLPDHRCPQGPALQLRRTPQGVLQGLWKRQRLLRQHVHRPPTEGPADLPPRRAQLRELLL